MKITRCAIATITAVDKKHTNTWIEGEIKIVRHYDVGTGNRAYRNLLVEMNLADHTIAIGRGKIIVGFQQCKLHEYSDPIQCKKCWRYGHFKHSCKFTVVCRICGKGTHTDDECDAARDSCVNCIRHNRDATIKVNTNHRVMDDRCPVRVSRNERIKDFLMAQQPRQGGRDQNATLNTSLNATMMTIE